MRRKRFISAVLLYVVPILMVGALTRESGAQERNQSTAVASSAPEFAHSSPLQRLAPKLKQFFDSKGAKGSALPQSQILSQPAASGIPRPNFGGFHAAKTYPAGADTQGYLIPIQVSAVADFNRDGRPDLVTLQEDGTLSVILNKGDGSFGKPWSAWMFEPILYRISQFFPAELNGDGYVDLIAFDIFGYIHVLFNQRNGTFAFPVVIADFNKGKDEEGDSGIPPNFSLGSAAVADVNGDGNQDIVLIGTAYDTHDTTLILIQTFLGNGDGTFITDNRYILSSLEPVPVGDVPPGRATTLADMNGDGKLDFVVEIHGLDTTSSDKQLLMKVVTFPGNGDGTFQPGLWTGALTINVDGGVSIEGRPKSALSITDLNHDSILDVVLAFHHSEYKIFSGLGNGDGTFGAPIVAATDAYADDLVVADFDGDGSPELIQKDGSFVGVYQSNDDGTFALAARYAASRKYWFGYFDIADFNGDGLLDFGTVDCWENKFSIYLSANGAFEAAPSVLRTDENIEHIWPQTALDLNGDGNQDVFFNQWLHGIQSLISGLNDGTGNFRFVDALAPDSAFDWADPKAADFNGDGKADLVLHYSDGGRTGIALSNGDGTFQPPIMLNPITSPAIDGCTFGEWISGDVNGDSKADLIVGNAGDDACGSTSPYGPGFFVLLSNGDGTFAAAVHYKLGSAPYKPILADFNGDYLLDLVVSDMPLDASSAPFNTFLLLGNGDGTFASPTALLAGHIVADILDGDTNGDGKRDLILLSAGFVDSFGAVYRSLAGAVELLGNGDGTFGSPLTFSTGFPAATGALVDVNGDGVLDLVSSQYMLMDSNQTHAGLSVAIGFGDGSFSPAINYAAGAMPWKVLPIDLFADGFPELLVSTEWGGTLMLNEGGTRNLLTSSANPAGIGQEITFTSTLIPAIIGRPLPSGAVDFFDGSIFLGNATLNEGIATFSTSDLTAGVHNVVARYGGDENFNLSTSNTVSLAINALPPDITVISTPSSLSISRGDTGLITLSVAANGNFSGAVQFQCSGLPSGTECQFNPSTLELASNQTVSATMVIATNRNVASLNSLTFAASRTGGWMPWQAALGVPGLLLLWPYRRKLRRSTMSLCALVLILVSVAGMTACGDSDSSTPQPKTSVVTITANATSGSTVVTRTTTISLTLQ